MEILFLPLQALAIMIDYPFLALLPAALFYILYRRFHRKGLRRTAVMWLVYCPYEYAMKLRILCTGECNIRVDLLLIYPLVVIVSLIVLFKLFKGGKASMTEKKNKHAL